VTAEPLGWLAEVEPEVRDQIANWLNESEKAEFQHHWRMFARPAQLPPPGDWRYWLIMAGRGFGKTRTGAEWVRMVAESGPNARIALVSSSLAEARAVMVEGEAWLVVAPASGDWIGQEDTLATYTGSQWLFIPPQAGIRVFHRSSRQFYLYDNAWTSASEPAVPSGGTAIDSEARDTIAEIVTALRTAGILAQV